MKTRVGAPSSAYLFRHTVVEQRPKDIFVSLDGKKQESCELGNFWDNILLNRSMGVGPSITVLGA